MDINQPRVAAGILGMDAAWLAWCRGNMVSHTVKWNTVLASGMYGPLMHSL